MALSERELNIAQQVKDQWGTEEDFMDILQQIRSEQPTESEPVAEPVEQKSTAIIPTPEGPIEDKSFLQKAGESIKEQVTTGLVSKGIGTAERAGENLASWEVMKTLKWIAQVPESWLQIVGGAVGEVFNQALNAAWSVLKSGLETLDPQTLEKLRSASNLPVDKLKEFTGNKTVKALGSTIAKSWDKIPENLRSDAEAFLNILPAKVATKNIALTEKGALKMSEKLLTKAEKLSSEIIKPWKYDEFATKAFVDNIKTAKTYKQLQTNLESALKTTGSQLDTALSKVWQVPKDERVKGAIDFLINDLKSNPVLAALPERAAKIKELEALSKWMGWGGKNIKLSDVQKIKREFDDTFNIYAKSGDVKAGDAARALEPERKYLREFIEKNAPEVKDLNKNYEGLREATDLAKERARQFGNDATPDATFFSSIRDRIPFIKRLESEAPSRLKIEASKLWSKTAEIEALKNTAKSIRPISEVIKLPNISEKLNPLWNLFKKK